jgi:phage terminase small subunit
VDGREPLRAVVENMPPARWGHGQLMANPLSRRIRDLTQEIDRISDRFGMNPMARWRLQFTVSEAGKSAAGLLSC